jgi:hypothetical protein
MVKNHDARIDLQGDRTCSANGGLTPFNDCIVECRNADLDNALNV